MHRVGKDDREALARKLREGDDPVNTWDQATEAQREFWRTEAARALSRAAVPDAATEQARADSEWRDGTIIAQLAKAEAERDAALAAVERVRAIAERSAVNPLIRIAEILAALDGRL